jgi:hypothetical protein
LDGLHRLQKDIWAKASIVLLFVVAFLSLSAIFAQPADADLIDAVIDEAADVIETTVTPADEEADEAAPAEEIEVEVLPPVVEEVLDVVGDVPPVVEDVLEVVEDGPPVVEDLLEVVGNVPPVVEDVAEVMEDVPPVVEILEDVPVVVEIVEDVLPVISDVVIAIPTQVTDVVILPPFVPTAPESPGPVDPTVSVPTIGNPPEVSHTSGLTTDKSQPLGGLFNKELVTEMALFHLADLTTGSTANAPSSSSPPEQKTPGLAAYVPIAGTMPVVGGAGASSASGASHSGSSSFGGGLDAFSFFAAMAALLALCIVGWIRDRSRSGRSIFPSHGGRPG